MKSKLRVLLLALTLFATAQATAQIPVITSFSQNGTLVCSNLVPNGAALVEWASSPSGPWYNSWNNLAAPVADSNGAIHVSVPMFYRVRGILPPTNGMVIIPAGSFTIGNSLAVGGSDPDITDATPATVSVSAFYMDANLVSYSLWQSVAAAATNVLGYTFPTNAIRNPSGWGSNYPVQSNYWGNAVLWCNARSQLAGLKPVYYTDAGLTQLFTNYANVTPPTIYPDWTASGYRLPTEAEWEKAARGGLVGKRFPLGDTISENLANYLGNTSTYGYDLGPDGYNPAGFGGNGPTPVGMFELNGYGLSDMAGNLDEWCWDWYAGPSYPAGSPYLGGSDPHGPDTGIARVVRGGSFADEARVARCAYRLSTSPISLGVKVVGFRCVRKY